MGGAVYVSGLELSRVIAAMIVLCVAALLFYVFGRRDLAERVLMLAVVISLAYAFNVPVALQLSG